MEKRERACFTSAAKIIKYIIIPICRGARSSQPGGTQGGQNAVRMETVFPAVLRLFFADFRHKLFYNNIALYIGHIRILHHRHKVKSNSKIVTVTGFMNYHAAVRNDRVIL
jgi:hypothetical protein